MKKESGWLSLAAAGIGMLCLVLDSKYTSQSAASALMLCIRTVIPSLFPMLVLSGYMVGRLEDHPSLTDWVGRFLHLARGSGGLFLIGILGGFPVGAVCIAQAVRKGVLSREDGERMLGFCNNCSPAFLFGIVGTLFSSPRTALWIFLIQLESAMLCAWMESFHGTGRVSCPSNPVTLTEAVSRGCRSMVSVCGWVILAGVLKGFLERWFFPMLPEFLCLWISGLLELTGGIMSLSRVAEEGLRFLLSTVFVNFGGICVLLQIRSAAWEAGLSCGICIRQKLLQSATAGLLGVLFLKMGPVVLLFPPVFGILRKKLWKFQDTGCIIAPIREG